MAGQTRDGCETRTGAVAEASGPAADIDSRALFGNAKVVTIRHGGDVYTLRITRSDKLILTK